MFIASSFLPRRIARLAALTGVLALRALAADPAPTDAQARFEVDFLTDLIDHDQAALEMAQQVADRSQRPELRTLATDQVTAETAEIKALQGWLKEWYGETYEPLLDRRTERLITTLSGLQRDAFEQALLRALSLHHAKTLALASHGLLRAAHSKLIDQIRETVTVQADEIALMRGWLLKWYNINEVTSADLPDSRRWDTQGPIALVATTTTTTPATTTKGTTTTTTASPTTSTSAAPETAPTTATNPGGP